MRQIEKLDRYSVVHARRSRWRFAFTKHATNLAKSNRYGNVTQHTTHATTALELIRSPSG